MSSLVQPVALDQACDACRRRSWLLGALVGHLEVVWQQRRPLRDVLALGDEELIAAVGGTGGAALTAAHEAFDGRTARADEARAGTRAVCVHDPAFPTGLRTGPGAPPILHVAASVEDPVSRLAAAMAAPVVAIVGTRRASDDALEMARALGRGLGRAGVTVVSGLALGIDAAAHAGAIEGGGLTIAVLAGAAEIPYPRSKADLHRRILATSCVVSELPPGCTPRRWCFPARNRVIAGLSAVTVVVEGAERSGSLITADFAAQLGRDVAAVPGPAVSARARGSNGLIRDGAAVVLGAEDVLDLVLGVGGYDEPESGPDAGEARRGRRLRVALAPELETLLEAIGAGRRTLAALARTPAEADAVLVGLADLEARGLVRRLPGGQWVAAVDA